jgi:hypothetical protein
MSRLKHILILVMSISILTVGLPVQAKSSCPMAASVMMKDMQTGHDCNNCQKTTKHEKKQQNGCCKNMACNTQCAGMSGLDNVSMFKYTSPNGIRSAAIFIIAGSVPSSHLLNTQERPPKSLS